MNKKRLTVNKMVAGLRSAVGRIEDCVNRELLPATALGLVAKIKAFTALPRHKQPRRACTRLHKLLVYVLLSVVVDYVKQVHRAPLTTPASAPPPASPEN